jgi:hypothetical protein
MALSLGPDGIVPLPPGAWQVGVNFRYLYADEGWLGTHRWPAYETIVGNQITVVSTDVQVSHAFTHRYSLTLTVPAMDGQTSNPQEHDGTRHTVRVRGIGDIRIVGNFWGLDPAAHRAGNFSLGLGLKFPTGNDNATAIFYKSTGPQRLPADISIQPGDGGFGFVLELSAYRKLAAGLHGYLNGFYLINPREQNDAVTQAPYRGVIRHLSVPDQYLFRTGLSWSPAPAWSLSLGFRIDGIPPHDLIGGSEGFRRPGYVIYVEPGLSWTKKAHTVSFYLPLRRDANRQRNVYDERANVDGGGTFARRLFIVSYAYAF